MIIVGGLVLFLQLINAARDGNEGSFAQLCQSYKPLIETMVARYCDLADGRIEKEDLRQEATVAFYKAVTTFDIAQDEVTFGLYAKICIRNRMVSLLRKLNKKSSKRVPGAGHEKEARLFDLPYDREYIVELSEKLLTDTERRTFFLYAEGKSYKEMSSLLSISEKSVDNALFRAKTKLKKALSQ